MPLTIIFLENCFIFPLKARKSLNKSLERGFSHVSLTSVKDGFVIEVIQHYTSAYEEMKCKYEN